jgi:hypothetical protein
VTTHSMNPSSDTPPPPSLPAALASHTPPPSPRGGSAPTTPALWPPMGPPPAPWPRYSDGTATPTASGPSLPTASSPEECSILAASPPEPAVTPYRPSATAPLSLFRTDRNVNAAPVRKENMTASITPDKSLEPRPTRPRLSPSPRKRADTSSMTTRVRATAPTAPRCRGSSRASGSAAEQAGHQLRRPAPWPSRQNRRTLP